MKKTTTLSIQMFVGVLLLALASSIHADDRWATSGTGGRVINSYGDCYKSLGGNKNICQKDADGDGVADDMDKCPDTPKGVQVDAEGCPLDTDRDGVPDYQDQCPQTPTGATVDEVGCMKQLILNNIEFKVDSSALNASAQATLNQVADALRGRPDVRGMSVIGHTDSTGSTGYNQKLSERRAASVADYLRRNASRVRFTSAGKGESMPIADNNTEEGRSKNRRVELNVIR